MVYNLLLTTGKKIIDIVKNLDIGSIFTILTGGALVYGVVKIGRALDMLTSPMEGLGHMFFEAGETLEVFQKTLKGFSLNLKAEAIKSIAIAIAILAGSVAVLSMLDRFGTKDRCHQSGIQFANSHGCLFFQGFGELDQASSCTSYRRCTLGEICFVGTFHHSGQWQVLPLLRW